MPDQTVAGPTPEQARGDDAFCAIIAGDAPAAVVRYWDDATAILPRGPVVEDGHIMVIPKTHVATMLDDPEVTGLVAKRAAELAIDLGWRHGHFAFNLGEHGGQTVDHLHGHLLLASEQVRHTMPWFGQKLRAGRRFYIGADGAGDLTLWTGDPKCPLPVAAKHQLDDMDPLLWPLVTTVLAAEVLPDGESDA